MARRRRRGFTLPEVLTVCVIFGIIVMSVSAIYMAALRAYRRGEPANSAERKASWAVSRMLPDFQHAIQVIPASHPNERTAVATRAPDRVWNAVDGVHYNNVALTGEGDLYLVAGDLVYYYRGDDAGVMSPTGSKLWRTVVHSDGSLGKSYVVADNLVDNPDQGGGPKPMFIYWPDVTRLRSVEITVTVQERAGAEVANSTMVSEVCFRNH